MFKTSAIHPPPNKLGGGLLAEDDKVPGISRCSVEQFLKLKEEKFYSKKQNSLAMMI